MTVSEENPRHFLFDIQGPPGSFYEAGTFKVEIFLPPDYPMSPPKALFRTKVFHPNIDKVGRICLDILKQDKWTPALLIEKVVLSIQWLLGAPNIDDPLDESVADVFKSSLEEAEKKAREWVQLYAK